MIRQSRCPGECPQTLVIHFIGEALLCKFAGFSKTNNPGYIFRT